MLGIGNAFRSKLFGRAAVAAASNHATRRYICHNRFMRRVSIIGAGGVGSTIAAMTMSKNVADEILLVDAMEDFLKGQVFDLSDANINNGTKVRSATWKEAGQADVIVITAGAKQRSGESRQEVKKKEGPFVVDANDNNNPPPPPSASGS